MKKMFIPFFLIVANICFAQNLQFPMTSEGVVEYYEKVSSANNKEIICQKIEQWCQITADNLDSIERKEDTTIIRKNIVLSAHSDIFVYYRKVHNEGSLDEYVYEAAFNECFKERIGFTVEVLCEDFQYQYWIKNILFTNRYEGVLGNYDSTQTLTLLINEFIKTNEEIAAIENDPSISKMKKKKKLDKPNMTAAKNSRSLINISRVMDAAIASLKEKME